MKNLTCIFLSLLFSFSLYSQSWFSENQKWSYSSAIYEWIIGVEQVQVIGETNFDGKDCLIFEQFIEGSEYMQTEVLDISINLYAYEEDDVIYAHFNGSWQAIYDFNMEVGDTLSYLPVECLEAISYTVIEVGTTEIDGQELRTQTILIDGLFEPETSIIVEKLGFFRDENSLSGEGYLFMHEMIGCVYDYYPSRGFHCYKDSVVNYNPNDLDCSFVISSTNELANFGAFRLSPNPTTDYLHFTADQINQVHELRILSINGQLMWKSQVIKDKIDVQDFSSGMYFLQILDENGTQETFKWIKKN